MLINPAVPAGGRSSEITKSCQILPALGAAVTHWALWRLFPCNLPEFSKRYSLQASWYDDIYLTGPSVITYCGPFYIISIVPGWGDPEASLGPLNHPPEETKQMLKNKDLNDRTKVCSELLSGEDHKPRNAEEGAVNKGCKKASLALAGD